MKFDFDSVISRTGTGSVKWDDIPDVLPMWVADMDFKAAPVILEALKRRVEHGIFGYTLVRKSYYDAVRNWFSRRHGWDISREDIIPIEGIVPAVSIAISALSREGDSVIMHTPAYNCFFSSIRNTGRVLSENVLVNEDGRYSIDFEDFERRCAAPGGKVFLLCNPQNPVGRLWTKEELLRLSSICEKYSVPVISDEIHCEICPPGSEYTPFATVSEYTRTHAVSMVSPTKAFNIAGIQIANMVCADPDIRRRLDRVINDWEHCDVNQFGPVALEAAYSDEGAEWLDEMNRYVYENYLLLKSEFVKVFGEGIVTPLEATYLAWIDVSKLGLDGKEVTESLIATEKVRVNDGAIYGDGRFIRVNLACPRSTLKEGTERIIRGLKRLTAKTCTPQGPGNCR